MAAFRRMHEQDPNRSMVKKNATHYDKTQNANFLENRT